MRLLKPTLLALSLTAALPALAAPTTRPATTPPPSVSPTATLLTTDEIKKLYDAGSYRDVLKALLPVLQLRGPAAVNYDRHELLILRAQTQMHLHENPAALDALNLAKKEAAEADSKEHLDDAVAFITLLQKSSANAYTPKTTAPGGSKKPIDIIEPANRKTALQALFNDELVPLQNKAKEAQIARSLQPILATAKSAGDLQAIERVANGNNEKTEKLVADLSEHALKLVTTEITSLNDQVERISKNAQTIISESVPVADPSGKSSGATATRTRPRGLVGNDAETLKNIKATCDKVGPSMEDLSKALRANADQFKAQGDRAKEIKTKADNILNTDYSSMGSMSTPVQTGTTPRR